MNAKIIIIKEIFQTWSKLTLMGQCFISARLWQSYQDHKHSCCGTSHAIFGSRNSVPAGKGLNAFFLSTVFCQASTVILALYPNFPCGGSGKALLHPSTFHGCVLRCPRHRISFVILVSSLILLSLGSKFLLLLFRVAKASFLLSLLVSILGSARKHETFCTSYDVNNCRHWFASSF